MKTELQTWALHRGFADSSLPPLQAPRRADSNISIFTTVICPSPPWIVRHDQSTFFRYSGRKLAAVLHLRTDESACLP